MSGHISATSPNATRIVFRGQTLVGSGAEQLLLRGLSHMVEKVLVGIMGSLGSLLHLNSPTCTIGTTTSAFRMSAALELHIDTSTFFAGCIYETLTTRAQVLLLRFCLAFSFYCYWFQAQDVHRTMPQSVDACHFQMSGLTTVARRDAVLTVTHAKTWKADDCWRAVVSVCGQEREFGKCRPSIIEAVKSFMDDRGNRIPKSERSMLMQHATAMQLRRGSPGPQPSSVASGQMLVQSPAPDTQCTLQRSGVQFVHQIYGLFGDGKPMNALFEDSQRCWQKVAEGMSARYILWTASEVEALVFQKYPQYWKMYIKVRYPVMRCDIARMLIIHSYGGLYADLDTKPNRTWYQQFPLALPRIKRDPRKNKHKRNPVTRSWMPKRSAQIAGGKDTSSYVDMEVIVGTKGNEFFSRWLDYVQAEIMTKPYWQKKSFWAKAKMRYIYHTTGPHCLNRFLKLPRNAEWLAAKNLHYLECNHFSEACELTVLGRRQFDIISYESNSYFTKDHRLKVPVGAGGGTLPLHVNKRKFGKLAASEHEMIERTKNESSAGRVVTDELLTRMRAREVMLKRHCYNNRHKLSFLRFVQSMPVELKTWLVPAIVQRQVFEEAIPMADGSLR